MHCHCFSFFTIKIIPVNGYSSQKDARHLEAHCLPYYCWPLPVFYVTASRLYSFQTRLTYSSLPTTPHIFSGSTIVHPEAGLFQPDLSALVVSALIVWEYRYVLAHVISPIEVKDADQDAAWEFVPLSVPVCGTSCDVAAPGAPVVHVVQLQPACVPPVHVVLEA